MTVAAVEEFDVIVLGGGTGGYAAAFRAGQLGLRVALVEQAKVGGTCLHVGCIPTKAMIESAEFYARLRKATEFGILLGSAPRVDYLRIATRRDEVVNRMWMGLKGLVAKKKVAYIAGRGRLDGPHRVVVTLHGDDGGREAGDERVITATNTVVATGSRVKSLPGLVPDGSRIITSDDVTTKSDLPRSIIVVGAGAVGCEFASMYADLGLPVTLLERLPSVMPLEDRDVSREVERAFVRRGITVLTNAQFDPSSVQAGAEGVRVVVDRDGDASRELQADQLLVATGRSSNVEDLGLETTRVEVDRGLVMVSKGMQTAEPNVWAIGDVVGGLLLAHVAAHEGLIAIENIVAGEAVHEIDYDRQPRATYSRPQVASIGLTEQQCEERGIEIRRGRFPFLADAKAVIVGEHEGFVKVIADAKTDAVLGVHMVGPSVTEFIGEASVGLAHGATAASLGEATHAHPTLAEALGEAALAVAGRQINI